MNAISRLRAFTKREVETKMRILKVNEGTRCVLMDINNQTENFPPNRQKRSTFIVLD